LTVNLLPAGYRMRHAAHRRLQRWTITAGLVLAAQVLCGFVLVPLAGRARGLQQGLADAQIQRAALLQRLASLTAEEQDIARQMTLAEQLARKHRWSELLGRLAGELPDTIVLLRCETSPARSAGVQGELVLSAERLNAPAGAGGAPGQPPSAPADVAAGLVLAGMAADHDSVALLLRRLNAAETLGRWSIESTVRQPYMSGQGVMFTLRCQW
jgi:Tfp pilus assembly protein PilN